MTKSIYAQIGAIKQTKYDKLLGQIVIKQNFIDELVQQSKVLQTELDALKAKFPARKKAIYDEYFSGAVDRKIFEIIGYRVMVLEQEMNALQLKIKNHDESIATAKSELAVLLEQKKEYVRTLEKYSILIEVDQQQQKLQMEFKEEAELEEFASPKKRL